MAATDALSLSGTDSKKRLRNRLTDDTISTSCNVAMHQPKSSGFDMLRYLFVLILVTPAIAAPKLDKERPEPYFPTKVGTTRVYEWIFVKNNLEFTHIVEKSEKQSDGVELVTSVVKTKTGGIWKKESYAVSCENVSQINLDGKGDKKRYELLKLPVKVGDEWTTEDLSNNKVIQKIVAIDEEITVPAGKFKCIVVEQTHHVIGASRVFDSKVWYAPGVGLVKSEDGTGRQTRVIHLKSISVGK